MSIITIDIVEKNGHDWRIIGNVPTRIAESGSVHVYRGRNARILDAVTDTVIIKGQSLRDVLQKLADLAQQLVLLSDEITWDEETFLPRKLTLKEVARNMETELTKLGFAAGVRVRKGMVILKACLQLGDGLVCTWDEYGMTARVTCNGIKVDVPWDVASVLDSARHMAVSRGYPRTRVA